METLHDRFTRQTKREGDCLLWTGYTRADGYGYISIDHYPARVHRVAFRLANGRDPRPGLFVIHSCDRRACVEPTHLREGTHQENMADMVKRRRQATGDRHGSWTPDEELRERRRAQRRAKYLNTLSPSKRAAAEDRGPRYPQVR